MDNVLASLAYENLYPSKEAQKITEQFSDGTITEEEAIAKIKNLYNIKEIK